MAESRTSPIRGAADPPLAAGLGERWTLLAAAVLVLAGLAVYANSYRGPLVMDDALSITGNASIRHLWPPGEFLKVLHPPGGGTAVSGRPVLNLTFAINYLLAQVWTGDPFQVWCYHATNVVIHLLTGLLLLGVVRRTLLSARLRGRFGAAATPLALATALLWLVHPLATAAVDYLSQRGEALVALFFLGTLYGVIRAAQSPRPWRWGSLAVVSCLLGMGSKESMAAAPLLVLLYDRGFLSDSFRSLWRRRWGLHLAVAGTWGLLAWLALSTGNRSGTVGWQAANLWDFDLTQVWALIHFLALSFWPYPLIFDYGTALQHHFSAVWPQAVVLVGLLVATGVLVWRLAPAGFAGAVFFLILAPSSSLIPLATQPIGEHRMYLPLAAVVALVVVGGFGLWQCFMRRTGWSGGRFWVPPVVVGVLAAIALGAATVRRNAVYQSSVRLWQDTVQRRPDNARAHNTLGAALAQIGRFPQALEEYHEALQLKPDYAQAHNNLAVALEQMGRMPQALEEYHEALRLKPDYPEAHNNLGNALLSIGQVSEAIQEYQAALRLEPDYPRAHYNLALALTAAGQTREAIQQYQEALRLSPGYTAVQKNLALLLATLSPGQGGDPPRAIRLAQEACRSTQDRDASCLAILAQAYASAGRFPEAARAAEKAGAVARRAGQEALARAMEGYAALYRSGRSLR